MIIWSDVTGLAAELAGVSVVAQAAILAHVNTALNVNEWGGEGSAKLRLARIYLAAHQGATSSRGASGATGPVVSESADGLSRSYATSAAAASVFGSTPYGQAFIDLARSTPARGPYLFP